MRFLGQRSYCTRLLGNPHKLKEDETTTNTGAATLVEVAESSIAACTGSTVGERFRFKA